MELQRKRRRGSPRRRFVDVDERGREIVGVKAKGGRWIGWEMEADDLLKQPKEEEDWK